MNTIGIICRIDNLSRIVIPKEIRRITNIREGDALECYATSEGEIVFKKYSSMKNEVGVLAKQLCDAAFSCFGFPIAITDDVVVIAASGAEKNAIIERPVSSEVIQIMSKHKAYTDNNAQTILLDAFNTCPITDIIPIMQGNTCIGSVAIIGNENMRCTINENERYIAAKMVAEVLKNHLNSFYNANITISKKHSLAHPQRQKRSGK